MGSVNFLKAEAGRQDAHGTPVTPTFQLPFVGNYTDEQEEHMAPWDAGAWIAGEELVKVNDYATMSFNGTASFEMLPMFFFGGYQFQAPGTPDFTYQDAINLNQAGIPNPYTFRFGAVDEPLFGGGGPAVQLANAYCMNLTLSGGINARAVGFTSDWFAAGVDDNFDDAQGAPVGYPFAATATPGPRNYLIALGNNIEIDAAQDTGGLFETMLPFECDTIDWELSINFGTVPKWGADGDGLSYCGVRFNQPSIEFRPTMRTNDRTYQRVRHRYNTREYLELRLRVNGVGADTNATFQITGQWVSCPQPHGRANDEVVMQPVFRAKRVPSQTTTPHLFDWNIKGEYEHA